MTMASPIFLEDEGMVVPPRCGRRASHFGIRMAMTQDDRQMHNRLRAFGCPQMKIPFRSRAGLRPRGVRRGEFGLKAVGRPK